MKKALIVFIISAIFAGLANGNTLAGWEVTGIDVADGTGIDEGVSPYTFTATTFGLNVATAKLSLGSGVTPSTTASKYGFKVPGGDEQTTLDGAIQNNHYFQFTIEAISGYKINLASIEMLGEATGHGADDVAVLSSIDDYSAVIASVTGIADQTGGLDTDDSGFKKPIDLSSSEFQGLTGTTTFRFYGYNTTSGSGSTRIRTYESEGDDLIINGTTEAIPEPTTFALISLLGGLAFFRRRLFMK